MLGQIKVDFIFGVVIFSVVIFYIVTQANTLFSSLLVDSKSDALKAKAINSIRVLVEDAGDPTNWDTLPPANVKRVGLAFNKTFSQPYNISRSKVAALNANCSSSGVFNNLLWNYDFKAYRLRIFNSTEASLSNRILLCGFDSLDPAAVTEVNYVFIDNVYGMVILEIW